MVTTSITYGCCSSIWIWTTVIDPASAIFTRLLELYMRDIRSLRNVGTGGRFWITQPRSLLHM